LHELEVGRRPRSIEVEGMSGEAQHWVGVSREAAIVAVLGYLERRELCVYRAGEHGLELVWRRACGSGALLLGDVQCQALYVLHARAQAEATWLSRLGETPLELEDEPDTEMGLGRFDGFELWNCTAPDEHHHQGQPPIEGPQRNTPSAVLDDFVRQHPGDYHGLRQLWARLARMYASDAELARLVTAHPGSGAVRLFAAHESGSDGNWGEARRLLRGLGPSDVDADGARHLCHLQSLCCLLARDYPQARSWVERGLAHEGSCALENLKLAVEPLAMPSLRPAADVVRTTLPGTAAEASPVTQLRHLLRELDGWLEADPARVIDHRVFRKNPPDVQMLARRAAAWLCFEPTGPEPRARRTLELARFGESLELLDLATRDVFLPEAWSLEELLALRERVRHALGETSASAHPEPGEAHSSRPPALPHEVAARMVPGFAEQLAAALDRWGASSSGIDAPQVGAAELLSTPSVRTFLAREVRRQTLECGSRRRSRDRVRGLTELLVASVNYGLCLRKTFWVDPALSAKLRHTQLDIRGAVLNLPFPCCAFVFTEAAVLSSARTLVRLDPDWRETERIAVVTVYLMRSEGSEASPAGASATLHVWLAVSAWGQALPWMLVRDLEVAPDADLDAILDSHLKDAVERELDPWLGAEALRQLLELTLNTVLYATSAEARPQALPGLSKRAPSDPLVLSGEAVFYLPDKIDISEGPPSVDPSRTPEALENQLSGPSIQHRVAVRGHWRRPPPQAADQRLRWVRPHFRGPREAVLVEREYRLGDGETP
jgi:hypothetical protein